MIYKKFKQIIDLQIAQHNRILELYKLKVDLVEVFSEESTVIELLWKEVLTEFGYDWLSWYLYEKDGISGKPIKELKAWDKEKEICKNIRNLWEYLIKEEYFVNQLITMTKNK